MANSLKSLLSLAFFLIALSLHVVEASPVREKRAGPSLVAPSGWKTSWTSTKRVSNGASTKFMGMFVVDKTATAVTQAHLNSCVSRCASTSKCGFVNLVKMTGSSQGNVICMLFPQYMASTVAKYSTGVQSSGGIVNYSYGIRSNCAPTKGGALTCTPAAVAAAAAPVTTTTVAVPAQTTTTAVATPSVSNAFFQTPTDTTFPVAPSGATLVEWKPCSSDLRNPAYINTLALTGSSTATVAYISQHGASSDFDNFFTSLANVVSDQVPLISPGFMTDDGASKYYRKGVNLAWGSGEDTWTVGQDDTTGAGCSSYDQYDSMINYFTRSGRFPNLQTIYIVGHSGGGNLVSRFSTINNNTPVTIKYVIANAASQAFFSDARPTNGSVASTCGGAYSYPYQWTGSMPRYVAARFTNPTDLFNRWIGRSIAYLVSDTDVAAGGVQNCQSISQGGAYRRDRNYAYWAYQNILAGTGVDVSAYTGYANMIAQGASAITTGGFNHAECTVANAKHTVDLIYQSDCGRAAILGNALPAGMGASYPIPSPTI